MRPLKILMLALFAASPAAAQQSAGHAPTGRELALKVCSDCHVVDTEAQNLASDAVPSFGAIAGNKETTAAHLRVFLQKPHGQMPDLQLSRAQIDDLVAYITSLGR